ncbi:unnamed protein product, partial [Gadus morhua 'NCC']
MGGVVGGVWVYYGIQMSFWSCWCVSAVPPTPSLPARQRQPLITHSATIISLHAAPASRR